MSLELNIKNINLNIWEVFEKKILSKYTRIIYYNKKDELFMKIWEKEYIWKYNFKYAYDCGYYKEISLIDNIIIDDSNDILGYITKKIDFHNLKIELNCKKDQCILSDNLDNIEYHNFLNILLKNTKLFNLAHIDLTPYNIGIKDGKYYIFDLESVVTLDKLNKLDSYKIYNPKLYVDSISKLLI